MDISDKRALRKHYINIRKALENSYVVKASRDICNQIKHDDLFLMSDSICIYMPINNEVDLTYLIDDCLKADKKVYIPKITNGIMDFYLYEGEDKLIDGYYNIKEPTGNKILSYDEKTLVIMPGVAFSKNGVRLGYGGGYYDTFLSKHTYVKTIAVCYNEQLADKLPYEKHDIKPQKIISNIPSPSAKLIH